MGFHLRRRSSIPVLPARYSVVSLPPTPSTPLPSYTACNLPPYSLFPLSPDDDIDPDLFSTFMTPQERNKFTCDRTLLISVIGIAVAFIEGLAFLYLSTLDLGNSPNVNQPMSPTKVGILPGTPVATTTALKRAVGLGQQIDYQIFLPRRSFPETLEYFKAFAKVLILMSFAIAFYGGAACTISSFPTSKGSPKWFRKASMFISVVAGVGMWVIVGHVLFSSAGPTSRAISLLMGLCVFLYQQAVVWKVYQQNMVLRDEYRIQVQNWRTAYNAENFIDDDEDIEDTTILDCNSNIVISFREKSPTMQNTRYI